MQKVMGPVGGHTVKLDGTAHQQQRKEWAEKGLLHRICRVFFIDDVVIYSTMDDH
jgi:hypothetical protein